MPVPALRQRDDRDPRVREQRRQRRVGHAAHALAEHERAQAHARGHERRERGVVEPAPACHYNIVNK